MVFCASKEKGMTLRLTSFLVIAALLAVAPFALASPIQKMQGTITEVGEGFLLLKPEDGPGSRKFLLRWKAKFDPPKLPLKGDRVLIFYKDKEEGSIIYELNYLSPAQEK